LLKTWGTFIISLELKLSNSSPVFSSLNEGISWIYLRRQICWRLNQSHLLCPPPLFSQLLQVIPWKILHSIEALLALSNTSLSQGRIWGSRLIVSANSCIVQLLYIGRRLNVYSDTSNTQSLMVFFFITQNPLVFKPILMLIGQVALMIVAQLEPIAFFLAQI